MYNPEPKFRSQVIFDLEHVLKCIHGFISADIFDFCCGGTNSDLTNINIDDLTCDFDDPCTISTLDALDYYYDTAMLFTQCK